MTGLAAQWPLCSGRKSLSKVTHTVVLTAGQLLPSPYPSGIPLPLRYLHLLPSLPPTQESRYSGPKHSPLNPLHSQSPPRAE